ncbi:MAG: TolC family protein [Bacteroidetes bacterium]|nr:MAG: TolC family protein [Bacteroidota bacterium]
MKKILFICALLCALIAQAQENPKVILENQSLKQCVDYALKNSVAIKNAQIGIEIVEAQKKQYTADGLPQVTGGFGTTYNYRIPKAFLPARLVDPKAEEGTFAAVEFSPQFSGQWQVGLQQILFDPSYIMALRAVPVAREVAEKDMTKTKITLVANVNKAYYAVLIQEQRRNLLDNNIARVESLLKDMKAMYQNGLAEKIDVDRTEVTYNNLKVDQQNFQRLLELSKILLKYQMGMESIDEISLSEKLADVKVSLPEKTEKFDYAQRIEYSMLISQTKVDQLTIKNHQFGYLPKLTLGANYGGNTGGDFAKVANPSNWFGFGSLSLNLQVPIFDGFRKSALIQKSKLDAQKTQNTMRDFRRTIDLQINQSSLTLQSNLETLESRKRNMELANEVFRLSNVKYKEGVGSNLEVINSESALREAETNYYAALYDALLAQVDLKVAKGDILE